MNGWNCRCTIRSLSERDLERWGLTVSDRPNIKTRPWTNKRTGQTIQVPEGIDPGFAHNIGAMAIHENASRVFSDKMISVEPEIAAAASAAAARVVINARAREYAGWLENVANGQAKASGLTRVVSVMSPETVAQLNRAGIRPSSAAITISDRAVLHMLREAKKSGLKPETIARLPKLLAEPKAILRDKRDGDLLYILDQPGLKRGKIVVRLEYKSRARTDVGRRRFQSASIRSGGRVDDSNLRDPQHYDVISGRV